MSNPATAEPTWRIGPTLYCICGIVPLLAILGLISACGPSGNDLLRGSDIRSGRSFYGCSPSFDHSNQMVAFASPHTDGVGDIFVVTLSSGKVSQITSDPAYEGDPCLSPDGRKVCFLSERTGNGEIFIADSDGSNVQQLTYNGSPRSAYRSDPLFRPKSSEVFYTERSVGFVGGEKRVRLMFMNLQSGRTDQLSAADCALTVAITFSDDGLQMYGYGKSNLQEEFATFGVYDMKLGRWTRLADGGFYDHHSDRILSPMQTGTNKWGNYIYEVFSSPRSPQRFVQLSHTDVGYLGDIRVSPDGSRIIFALTDHGNGPSSICDMAQDGSGLRQIWQKSAASPAP